MANLQLNVWFTGGFGCDLLQFCATFVHFLATIECQWVVMQRITGGNGDAAEGRRRPRLHFQYAPDRDNSAQSGEKPGMDAHVGVWDGLIQGCCTFL